MDYEWTAAQSRVQRKEKSIMQPKSFYLLLSIIPFLASCASQPVRLATVGPAPFSSESPLIREGRLQAFTEPSETVEDDVYYFPHSAYQIYTPDGKRFRYVWNHHTHQDEAPSVVTLPVGEYLIEANAEFCGRVVVPVVIKPNRTTRVVLQPGWKPNHKASLSQLVQSPSGYFVGWRADVSQTE
jgi:hypothetical protein